MKARSIYASGLPRTTTPLSRVHRQDKYQPADLQAAVRAVLRTTTHKLMLALAYLNGHAQAPVRTHVTKTGYRYIDDGHNGRIFEIAAAIEHIESVGLDPRVIQTLRGGHLSDEEAFAVLASGMTVTEAHRCWMDPYDLPPLDSLKVLAALRGFDTTPA